MQICKTGNSAFSTVFFLMALFLVASIHSQLGHIILNSSRIMHNKKKLLVDRRNDEKEILSILNNPSETVSSRKISKRYTEMTSYILETSSRRNIPILIHANSNHTPLKWRKFLSTGGTLEKCNEISNSSCTMNSLTLSEITKSSQPTLIINDTLLPQFPNPPVGLGVSGILIIKNLVLEERDEQIEQKRELLLLAASEAITIQHLDLGSISHRHIDIVLYTAQGRVVIESTSPHHNCLDQNQDMPGLYIIAHQIIIEGQEIDPPHYTCIPPTAKDWFPERKMPGFARLEP
jgi:hypothetical protein